MSEQYHFIGIGGIGMSALARLLLSKKLAVSGSDIALNYTIEGLIQEGAIIHKGHSADHVSAKSTVVYSSDIKPDNPEYAAAVALKCSLLHRSDLLASLIKDYRSLAVAGTHGKTTTSSLLATVLLEAGLDPSFAVGGILPQFQSNAFCGQGDLFVLEADESDRTFLKYSPFGAIVTNIDNDHLNAYEGSENVLKEAFHAFLSQVASEDHLFFCGDDVHLSLLANKGHAYGFGEKNTWQLSHVRQNNFCICFDLEDKATHKVYKDIELNLSGRHNALNGAAVFGLALKLGVKEESIRHSFKTFKGVLRRCEKKGECNGILFLDDYAHHPTEIQTTLEGIRQAIQSRRLIAVFQPHRYSRTYDCMGQWGTIFNAADKIIVTDIFGAGEPAIPGLLPELIVQEIQQHSSVTVHYTPRSALSHQISQIVQPQDVIVTLGAGDITKVGGEVLSLLEYHRLTF